MKNPWQYHQEGYGLVETMDAESRIYAVKSMKDPAELIAVIEWPGTQKTVRARAVAQLRRVLEKRVVDAADALSLHIRKGAGAASAEQGAVK